MPETTEGHLLLVRIETKLDVALRAQEDHERRIRALESHGTNDHDVRLTAVEKWRYALTPTIFLSIASIATAVSTAVLR